MDLGLFVPVLSGNGGTQSSCGNSCLAKWTARLNLILSVACVQVDVKMESCTTLVTFSSRLLLVFNTSFFSVELQ